MTDGGTQITQQSSVLAAAPHATIEMLDGVDEQFADIVNEYLHTFIDPRMDYDRCPNCERGGFTCGLAWGAGRCYACDWPGRLYHVISDRREEPALVCSATCNGFRVCEATRGEHVPHDQHWYSQDGTSSIETVLRCPNPAPPPGLASSFTSDYRPPEITRFQQLLWVHPDFVEKRT